jgi:hypothetical protein
MESSHPLRFSDFVACAGQGAAYVGITTALLFVLVSLTALPEHPNATPSKAVPSPQRDTEHPLAPLGYPLPETMA